MQYIYAFGEMIKHNTEPEKVADSPTPVGCVSPGNQSHSSAAIASAVASVCGAERIDPKASYPLLQNSLRMLDFTPAAIVGRHLQSLCVERDPAKVRDILQSLAAFAAGSPHRGSILLACLRHAYKLGRSASSLGSGALGVGQGIQAWHHLQPPVQS